MAGAPMFRGVPYSLARDGWWLACDAPVDVARSSAGRDGAQDGNSRGTAQASGATAPQILARLLALIVLADLLFWHYAPGMSVAAVEERARGVVAAFDRAVG